MSLRLSSTGQRALLVDAARLSRMAYSRPEKVLAMYEQAKSGTGIGMDIESNHVLRRVVEPPVHFDDPTSDAQGYGMQYDGPTGRMTIIAYRGTSSLADAFADTEIRLVTLKTNHLPEQKGCRVHSGFLNQFKALEQQTDEFLLRVYPEMRDDQVGVKTVLDSHQAFEIDDGHVVDIDAGDNSGLTVYENFMSGPPLLITGHSLASAISCLAANVYSVRYSAQVAWIGFGCPRAGNRLWASRLDSIVSPSFRVKNGRDPIDSIIPPIVYQHVGHNYIHVGRSDPFEDISLMVDIPDHNIAKYIANLLKDDTSEKPEMLSHVFGFLVNSVVRLYNVVRSAMHRK